jgi:hypothetical protein
MQYYSYHAGRSRFVAVAFFLEGEMFCVVWSLLYVLIWLISCCDVWSVTDQSSEWAFARSYQCFW